MERYPAVTVHGFAEACAALRRGPPVLLVSPPGAGLRGGPAWWLALIRAARQACPDREAADLLDCADAPGIAMAALRLGQRRLILHATSAAWPAVAAAAALLGAEVLGERPPCLTLATWLGHDTGRSPR
jgi:hypothetical protein